MKYLKVFLIYNLKSVIIFINNVKNMMLDFCIYFLLNFVYVCIKLYY